jgi:hypothetical protein
MAQWEAVTKGKEWSSERLKIRCDDGVIAD